MLSDEFVKYLLKDVYRKLITYDDFGLTSDENSIQKFKQNLNKLKNYVSSGNKDKYGFNPKVISRKVNPRKFGLTIQDQTYPYLSKFDGNKLEVSSIIYPNIHLKNSARFSTKFKNVYNKKFFKNGLDINNFEILNVYDRNGKPLKGADVFEDILRNDRGGIIPLNEKQGFFIPHEYPLKYTYGIEYEVPINESLTNRFNIISSEQIKTGLLNPVSSTETYFGKNEKAFFNIYSQYVKKYGFDFMNLLNFSTSDSYFKKASDYGLFTMERNGRQFQMNLRTTDGAFYIDDDFTVNRSDRISHLKFELPIGIMNITNGIIFNHYLVNALKEFGLGDNAFTSRFTKYNGMHINIGFNKIADVNKVHKAVSQYLLAIGLFGQRMFKDKERLKKEKYHSNTATNSPQTAFIDVNRNINRGIIDTRSDFKLSKGIIEYRHAGMILDSGYIANQLIYSSKVHDDIMAITDSLNNDNDLLYRKGSSNINKPILYNAELRGSKVKKEWVKEFFKNYLGFDDFMSEWAYNMHRKCGQVSNQRDTW